MLQKSKRIWKKITRRIRHKSLSNAKSALRYRQFHLPVSCNLRCCSRFWEISIREIQRNQRFRTRGVSPCGTGAYPNKVYDWIFQIQTYKVIESVKYKFGELRKWEVGGIYYEKNHNRNALHCAGSSLCRMKNATMQITLNGWTI